MRTLWRPVLDRLLPLCRADDDTLELVPGVRYACDVQGRRDAVDVLTFEEMSEWTAPASLLAEGFVEAPQQAVLLRNDRGDGVTLARRDVLWPAADHAEIAVATATLGTPLVPRRRAPRPQWRVGRTLVDWRSMAALGRTLTSG